MEYVFVGGRPSTNLDYSYDSIRLTGNLLISMIDVLNSSNSFSKAHSFFKSLNEMHQAYRKSIEFNTFLDSGGYSIIVGDVKASQIREFIERYNSRIIEGKNIYDKVFSLDIPILLNEPKYNTATNIYTFNKYSLEQTYDIAAKDSIIRKKLYFVWHFKIKEQYNIWSKLYNELNIGQYVSNRAAGGMVGLRGITQISFSPFIAPMYRSLLDWSQTNILEPFYFHALGVYIQHDRFFLIFLEKLFKDYEKIDDVFITYDSVNYMRTAQLKARELNIHRFNGNTIETFSHIDCPSEIYSEVYNSQNLNLILEDIDNVKNNQKLKDVGAFVPLNIYSNLQLDKFFEYIIDKYNIVEKFKKGNLTDVFATLGAAHPHVFTKRRIECLKMNFKQTWPFHQWKIKSGKYETFDQLMYKFIDDIGFPASFEETANINHIDIKDHLKNILSEE